MPLDEPLPGVEELGEPGVEELGEPGVGDVAPVPAVPECGVLVPDTPVAGGVVVAPVPVPGAHGTAVPLVPVGIAAALVAPVLRSVGLDAVPFEADVLAGAAPGVAAVAFALALPPVDVPLAAGAAPLCARGPASVAVFTLPLSDVVVPVELFTLAVGEDAAPLGVLALALPAPAVAVPDVAVPGVAVPTLVPVEAAPVTGTHGIVDGAAVGVVDVAPLPGCDVCVCVVAAGLDPAGFCAANAPTDSTAANAALLVMNAKRFFTKSLPFISRENRVHSACRSLGSAAGTARPFRRPARGGVAQRGAVRGWGRRCEPLHR